MQTQAETQTKDQTMLQQHEQNRRPPMHRGYSDLSNRIKKRVTLRYIWHIIPYNKIK